jgi:hypothetical protein
VLTGSSTFPWDNSGRAWLRANSKAILVGGHPGDRPDFWVEGGNVSLPNSGLVVHYTDVCSLSAIAMPPESAHVVRDDGGELCLASTIDNLRGLGNCNVRTDSANHAAVNNNRRASNYP